MYICVDDIWVSFVIFEKDNIYLAHEEIILLCIFGINGPFRHDCREPLRQKDINYSCVWHILLLSVTI